MSKKEIIKSVFNIVLFSTATYLTFRWFDWKLFIVLFMFLWSNNISQQKHKQR